MPYITLHIGRAVVALDRADMSVDEWMGWVAWMYTRYTYIHTYIHDDDAAEILSCTLNATQ